MADYEEKEIQALRALYWSDRDPEGRAFAPLADAYRRQGDLPQALELLEDGLGRHADFVPGHVVSGWVHRDRGETETAAAAFRTALELDDENAEALRGLGELAAAGGDLAGARTYFGKLVELEPADSEVAARLREFETPAGPDTGVAEPEHAPLTRTMADLYARQGLHERALRVYRRLLEREPGNAELHERVAVMEALAAGDTRSGAAGVSAGAGATGATDVETLVRDWAEGPSDTGELSTPFAWTPAPGSPPPQSGRPVREYFHGLLDWEPAAVPEPETALPEAARASKTTLPEAPLASESAPPEPEATPEAAPPEAARPAVPIAQLAPDQVVAIAELAPDAVTAPDEPTTGRVVPIAELATDVVDIAALAPDEPATHDFGGWLERLP